MFGTGALIKVLGGLGLLLAIGSYHWYAVHSANKAGYQRAAAECDIRVAVSIANARTEDAERNKRSLEQAVKDALHIAERDAAAARRDNEYGSYVQKLSPAEIECRKLSPAELERLR